MPLKEWEVRDTLTQAGGLVLMLARSGRGERDALYRALGVSLRYEKQAPTGQGRVHARLELCRGGGPIVALAPTDPAPMTVDAVLPLGTENRLPSSKSRAVTGQ